MFASKCIVEQSFILHIFSAWSPLDWWLGMPVMQCVQSTKLLYTGPG